MTKTANRRRKVIMPVSIKKKFGAAICMLLIAAIMMISSTYAWFTLSTAPEVKGIQTNVGANGNLEIALLDVDTFFRDDAENGFKIKSDIGDSMYTAGKDPTESNVTWGNIVDLSVDAYGLSGLTLLPGALNITEKTVDNVKTHTINGESPLFAPKYGSDGRVISVDKATTIGKKDGNLIMPYSEYVKRNGVGIAGVASTMTLRLSLYQAARTTALNAINAALDAANDELNNDATTLSTILVKVADGDDETTFSKDEMNILGGVIDAIQTANDHVWTAIKQIAIMSTLSKDNIDENNNDALERLTDDQLQGLVNEIEAADDYGELSAISYIRLDPLGDNTTGAIKNYLYTEQELANAKAAYTPLANEDQCTYDDAKSLLDLIIKNEHVTINGIPALGTNKEAIRSMLLAQLGTGITLDIKLEEGSGLFYDVAKSAGNVSTETEVDIQSLAGVAARVPAIIATNATTPLLPNARNNAGAGYTGGGSSGNIVDVYGYVIDFAFRTNAPTGSKLLLKSDATQRIYNDPSNPSTNTETLGGGTFVKFTSDKLTRDEIRALMLTLRIVFVTPEITTTTENNVTKKTVSYNVITVAVPDIHLNVDNGTYSGDEVITEGSKVTIKAPLALWTINLEPSPDGKGNIVRLATKRSDLELATLTQNTAVKISAIVYFDGDYVDNSMVANAAQSMSGALNLQFATDAELVPMENAYLRGGDDNQQGGNTPQTNYTKAQLSAALMYLSTNELYTGAVAANEAHTASDAQIALIEAVETARTVAAQDSPDQNDINEAVAGLISACTDLGVTIPGIGG